jgi:acyl-CoA reductase-like NAD-dependent aldehyde dehydrogenase
MNPDPRTWINTSPGDLQTQFPEITAGEPDAAIGRAVSAFRGWRATPLSDRRECLVACREQIAANKEPLARLIAGEVGKPLREARLELDAVIAKFGFAFADAEEFLEDREISDGLHPAMVRTRPRGPAAVIAPFNFPIHLGHGATLAYLLAGNPVLFKPSPLAANTCAAYGEILTRLLPSGVFQIVQGWTQVARDLSLDSRVRAVCFTGSYAAGQALAMDLAGDISKSLALELGGMNCLIVCEDADLSAAALAAADGLCLTTGQRCNATSRILVHSGAEKDFLAMFREAVALYVPGPPMDESTMFGPLVSRRSFERYQTLTSHSGDWVMAGQADDSRGFYVTPAVLKTSEPFPLGTSEFFCPVATLETFEDDRGAMALQAMDTMGLTASVFTASEERFAEFASELDVGNLYCNLPTTFSPSTLPFGGMLLAGNGHPGGRGFARFAANEQALQWKG